MNNTAKKIIFHGRVQGVGFRFTSHRFAIKHNLTGWVRNLANGNVEMFVQGQTGDVDDCLRDIRNSFMGYITEMEIRTNPPDSGCTDFRITF